MTPWQLSRDALAIRLMAEARAATPLRQFRLHALAEASLWLKRGDRAAAQGALAWAALYRRAGLAPRVLLTEAV